MKSSDDLFKNEIYENSKNDKYRYSLGIKGEEPLYCFGINPHFATPDFYDLTMKKLQKVANMHGFDSFVMFNIYPFRSSSPDALPNEMDSLENSQNIIKILEILKNGSSI